MSLADTVTPLLSSLASDDGAIESPEIGFSASPADPIGVRVVALKVADIALQPVSGHIFGQQALELSFQLPCKIIGISSVPLAVGAGIAERLAAHLRVLISIADHDSDMGRAQQFEARVTIRVTEQGFTARLLISPDTWGGASVAIVDAASFARSPLSFTCLPARVARIIVRHTRESRGRAYTAAFNGDCTRLLSALVEGGSTEEMDKVGVPVAAFKSSCDRMPNLC